VRPGKPIRFPLPADDSTEQAALRFLARRDRTEAQVRAYLSRTGASSGRIRALIKQFVKRGYLNDERYALRWASARLARRPMGRERLEAELIGQGLDRDTTERALEQVYGGRSERDLARALLNQSSDLRTLRGRSRGANLLRRHGFDEETIEEALQGSGSS